MNPTNPSVQASPIRINESGGIGTIIGCFILSAGLYWFAYFAWAHAPQNADRTSDKVAFCAIFFGIPTLLLLCALFLVRTRLKFGGATLFLDSPVQAGGALTGRIRVSKRLQLNRAEFISLKLKSIQMTWPGGVNTPMRTKTLSTTVSKVTRGKITLLPDRTTEIPFQIHVPPVQSSDGRRKVIYPIWWEIEAEAMPNNGPHFSASFKIN